VKIEPFSTARGYTNHPDLISRHPDSGDWRPPIIQSVVLTVLVILSFGIVSALPVAETKVREGIWKSHGEAELLVIEQGRYQAYDLTSVSCVPTESGPAREVLKRYPSIDSWTDARMVVSGYDFRYVLNRITEMPEPCLGNHDANDPFYNFDAFWQYYQENYRSFDLRGIDWQAMRETYRPRVSSGMSSAELFAVLGEMVEKLNDPHVFISNGKHGPDELFYGSPDPHGLAAAVRKTLPGKTTAFYRAAASKIEQSIETEIRYELLKGNFHTAHNERLTWGMLTPRVGYLRLSLAYGLFGSGISREQMYEQLDTTLDTVFADFKKAKALLIDVTTNTGGAQFVADAIARRVIQKPLIAYQAVHQRTGTGERCALLRTRYCLDKF
jgi:hypothetical protein